MTLIVEAVSNMDGLLSIEKEWDALDSDIDPRTPFTSSLWFITWWKFFRRKHLWVMDEFFLHVVRDENRKLLAVAPLISVRYPAFGPFRLRVLRFIGADTSLTEIRGVICRPEDQPASIQALLNFFEAQKYPWDLIEWKGISAGRGTRSVLERPGALSMQEPTPMYIMMLPNHWSDLVASVSSNTRKNVRKAYEALQGTGKKFELRVIEKLDDLDDALNRFFRLHSQRAQVQNMIDHPDKFKDPRNRAFINSYLSEMAKRDKLRLFELSVAGTVVASRICFYLDGTIYFYYAGYDPAWRTSSVGTILMAEAFKWAIERGIRKVNLSAGRDLSKLRWKPTEIIFENYIQKSPSLRGRILGEGYSKIYRRLTSARSIL